MHSINCFAIFTTHHKITWQICWEQPPMFIDNRWQYWVLNVVALLKLILAVVTVMVAYCTILLMNPANKVMFTALFMNPTNKVVSTALLINPANMAMSTAWHMNPANNNILIYYNYYLIDETWKYRAIWI